MILARMIKKWYKKLLKYLLGLFALFYIPYLYGYYRKQLKFLPKETQLFFVTRMDFGTFIALVHYAKCWEEVRGKTCIIPMTAAFPAIHALAKVMAPQSFFITADQALLRLLIKIFGPYRVNDAILYRVYARLFAENPHALRMYDPTLRSCYVSCFDRRLENVAVTQPFLDAYKDLRNNLNFCEHVWHDAFHLQFKCGLSRRALAEKSLSHLKKALKISDRYVVVNVNQKTYKEKGAVRKRICHPERYNSAIDLLIERGFSVVLQGRGEQPVFKARSGLIDYSKSTLCSIENDIALYSGCHFCINSKTGPELFSAACNTPQLGLNYSELCHLTPNVKLRFFPKQLKSKSLCRYLTWKEMLASPSFFDIGNHDYDRDIEYCDMEESEIIAAVEEFLPLASQEDEKWLDYTPGQQEFKKHLHPLHLDLYEVKSVPCNIYLTTR